MRKRLRKKLHRAYLTTICAWVVTFDDDLRQRLLKSEAGMPFRIAGGNTLWVRKLLRGRGLRYFVAVARKLSPETAVVAYWAEEFPTVRDEAVIFSSAEVLLPRDDPA